MRHRSNSALLFVFVCMVISVPIYAQQKKYALLIGNVDYTDTNFPKLTNPINDARLMRSKLSQLDFETTLIEDATTEKAISELTQFYRKIKDADVAVFYYSGHGVNNYIVPAKSTINPAFLPNQCVSMEGIINEMRKASKLSFLFFDCCRSNYGDKGESGEYVGGLGPKVPNGTPSGLYAIYAAQEGKKASQGEGTISIFTQSLATRIMENREFRNVLNDIESDVLTASGGKQRPVFVGSYKNDFTFNTKKVEEKKTIKFILTPSTAVIDFGSGSVYKSGESLTLTVGASYSYTILAEGYASESYKMTVGSDTPGIKEYNLKKKDVPQTVETQKPEPVVKKRNVTINANTRAGVYWDGKYVGATPITFETAYGDHELKMTAYKYHDYRSTYEVTSSTDVITGYLIRDKYSSLINDEQTWGFSYVYGRYFPIGGSLSYSFEDIPFMMSLDFGVNTDKDKYIIDKVDMKDIANFTRTRNEYDAKFKLSFTPYAYFKYFAVGCGVGFLYMSGEENSESAYGSSSGSSSSGISISSSSSVSISGIGGTSKFKFMLSPVVKGFIPLSEDKLYLSLSVGYDYAFGYTEKNGVNAGIGLQFQF